MVVRTIQSLVSVPAVLACCTWLDCYCIFLGSLSHPSVLPMSEHHADVNCVVMEVKQNLVSAFVAQLLHAGLHNLENFCQSTVRNLEEGLLWLAALRVVSFCLAPVCKCARVAASLLKASISVWSAQAMLPSDAPIVVRALSFDDASCQCGVCVAGTVAGCG